MARGRLPLVLGLGAAGGIGYYLYQAGGDPKAAERKLEKDANSLNAEQELRNYGQKAGNKIDKAWSEADKQAGKLKSNTEAYAKDARAEAIKSIDKFDKSVEDGAAKAKAGISGWFGGGGSK